MVSNGTRNPNDDVRVDVEVKRLVELYGLRACRRSLDKLFAREEEEEKLIIGNNNNKIHVVQNHEQEQPAAATGGGGGGGSSVQRQQDELTAAIMDASVDAICTVDARGTIRSANRAAETSFGYQVGELVGHNIESILVLERNEDMLHSCSINGGSGGSGIKALHETCKGNSREVLARKKNGTEFPALLRIQRVGESTMINGDIDAATNINRSDVNDDGLEADSSSCLYVALIRDWSERSRVLRQLESQSALSENLKTAFLDASPDAIFAVCPVGNIVSVNRAGMKMFGYRSESEIVGQNIETIVAEEGQGLGQEASEKEIFMELFRADQSTVEGEEESETETSDVDAASSAASPAAPCRACQVGCKHELQCRRKNRSQFPAIVGVHRVEPFLFAFVRDTSEEQKARELEVSVRSADELLHNLLPDEIIERLKADPSHLADQHDNAPILFADIVGFTAMSSKMNPLELVRVLNDLFTRFDGLVEDYGLNKVKTIGDCYMVTSIPRRSDPRKACRAMCHFALDMLQALQEFNDEQQKQQTAVARGGEEEEEKEEQHQQQQKQKQEPLGLRVGINCGTVVAGVVGTNRFLYDLWGDAVNVASRMESTGVPLRIQVTKTVVDQVPSGEFDFEARGAIDVKGKGSMETYFLDKKKPSRTRDRNLLLRSLQENFTEQQHLASTLSSHDSRFRASTIEGLTRPRGLMSLLLGSRRRPSELTRSVQAQQPLKRFASDGHGECSESYRNFIATMNSNH